MEKTIKILKVIDFIFIWIILLSLITGLWFWHESNVAKVQYKMIEDALMVNARAITKK